MNKPTAIPFAFFSLAFRPLFWLASLFSVLSIGLWSLSFTGKLSFFPYGGSYFWHIHEMLFGFAATIVCGFLLTAVQTWTGVASIKGRPLIALVSIWLLARVLMMLPNTVPYYLVAAVDILFLPLSAIFLSIPVIKAKNWRNLFFIPMLFLMAIVNACMHASILNFIDISHIHLSHIMVMLISLVMCIMGGRVFPMFTANGTQTSRVLPISWLEKLSIITVIACIIVVSDIFSVNNMSAAIIFFTAGLVNFARALRWKIWVTFKTPLLWTLHISYWAMCFGLILLGMEKLQVLKNASVAYHTITVGGMGIMILSMISRVSLGHTGRTIKIGRLMTAAFLIMVLAFLTRTLFISLFDIYHLAIILSALFWCIAYGLFGIVYWSIVSKPRLL